MISVTCVRVRGTISLVLETDPSVASLYFNKKERMKNCYKELKVQDLDGKGYSGEAVQGKSPFLIQQENLSISGTWDGHTLEMPRACPWSLSGDERVRNLGGLCREQPGIVLFH